jgi:glyoxalase family protein
MHLVKRTVNFDDPAGYHLYFSTGAGSSGTLLTFFHWGRRGALGSGQIAGVTARVPRAVPLADPDGIGIEFVESADPPGIQSVTLCEADAGPTVTFLRDVLGLKMIREADTLWGRSPTCQRGLEACAAGASLPEARTGPTRPPNQSETHEGPAESGSVVRASSSKEANTARFALPDGAWIDIQHSPGTPRGKMAAGIVHHVALRVADEKTQLEWRERLIRAGLRVSPVKDRLYFHSIYFREPGGVLLEIATDGPGFAIDEPEDQLGHRLSLPPWLEPARASVERRLAPLTFSNKSTEADGR